MPLNVRIIDPQHTVYEGPAEFVMAPGKKGDMGIMPGHTPMFAELVPGEIHLVGNSEQKWALISGILKVRADMVTILIIPA